MYAALDLADRVGWTQNGGNPFQFARDVAEKPYLKERGVTMFTMNRAYFESHLLRRAVLGPVLRHVREGPHSTTWC